MTDDQDEALGTLRGAAEDLERLSEELHNRCMGDDIPTRAGDDMSEEFTRRIDIIKADIAKAEKVLAKSLS